MVGDGTRVPDTLTPLTRSYIVNVVTGDGGMQANTYTVRNSYGDCYYLRRQKNRMISSD